MALRIRARLYASLRKLRTIAWLWWHGVDVWNFNRLSRKPLQMLLEEVERQEVTLYYDKVNRRVARVPITVAVLIRILSEYVQLLEVKRVFANGYVDIRRKRWSMSETQIRGEELLESAIRGLKEELGLIVDASQFNLHLLTQLFPRYPSTAYHGIWTYALVTLVTLDLPNRPWQEDVKVIMDNGTQIYFQWFSMDETLHSESNLSGYL